MVVELALSVDEVSGTDRKGVGEIEWLVGHSVTSIASTTNPKETCPSTDAGTVASKPAPERVTTIVV